MKTHQFKEKKSNRERILDYQICVYRLHIKMPEGDYVQPRAP